MSAFFYPVAAFLPFSRCLSYISRWPPFYSTWLPSFASPQSPSFYTQSEVAHFYQLVVAFCFWRKTTFFFFLIPAGDCLLFLGGGYSLFLFVGCLLFPADGIHFLVGGCLLFLGGCLLLYRWLPFSFSFDGFSRWIAAFVSQPVVDLILASGYFFLADVCLVFQPVTRRRLLVFQPVTRKKSFLPSSTNWWVLQSVTAFLFYLVFASGCILLLTGGCVLWFGSCLLFDHILPVQKEYFSIHLFFLSEEKVSGTNEEDDSYY